MSSNCTCAKNHQTIPAARRVTVYAPNAEQRINGKIVRDMSKIFIYDKDCIEHGYKEIIIE